MNKHLARLALVAIAVFIVATCLNIHVYAPGIPFGPHHVTLAMLLLQLIGMFTVAVIGIVTVLGFAIFIGYLWEKAF